MNHGTKTNFTIILCNQNIEKFLSEYWISSSGLGIQHRSSSSHNVLLLETFLPFSPKWIPASSVKATWSWNKHQIRHEEKCAKVNLIFISSQHLYRSQQHLLPVLGLWGNSFNVLPPSFPLLGFSSQNKSCNKIGCVWIISRSFFQLEAQMEETRLSPILRQGFSHHSLGNNMATGTFLPIWTLLNLLQDTRKQQSHVPPAMQPRDIPAGQRNPQVFLLGCHRHNNVVGTMTSQAMRPLALPPAVGIWWYAKALRWRLLPVYRLIRKLDYSRL